jgi:hypothetical protein
MAAMQSCGNDPSFHVRTAQGATKPLPMSRYHKLIAASENHCQTELDSARQRPVKRQFLRLAPLPILPGHTEVTSRQRDQLF